MEIDWGLVAAIVAPIIALFVGAALDRALERRVNLLAYFGHVSSFEIKGTSPTTINTHTVVVRNAGRKPASDVRISHHHLPENFNIHPKVEYSVLNIPDGGAEIVIPTLRYGEEISISYLYFPPLTFQLINGPIRHSEGFAKGIAVLLQRQFPKWVQATVGVLMLAGLIAIVYLLLKLAIWRWLSYATSG